MKFIINDDSDDPNFIHNCEKIIGNRISLWKPRELFIIKTIDTFDSGWAENPQENVFAFWTLSEELIISLFHPGLISSISIYNNSYRGYYIPSTVSDYIKKRKQGEYLFIQSDHLSSKNYKFPPAEYCLLVWYSNKSAINDKGTIMFFYTINQQIKTIHITLSENEDWNISESFGISKSEIQSILNK
ncbi:hypothetical protein IX39_16805 [Chryseobacterium formosense]|uniref:Uncharacterized protein n=1 Tax=Chryseobacterium formosense TaxID=236814 RepID=A0A085Z0U3_9FLAO|nr:hypothetical protein [Chryseobacterium formosense]KFE98056.1 hypothetical protein IX39_16805 [Chryseobacterium formosense]SFT72662.1 hypothetical protein SAMN05421857_2769 [Chryseobacterium formosense]